MVLEVVIEEGEWRLAVEGAVAASAIVEGFEVVEEGGGGGLLGVEGPAIVEDFGFEGSEGAFCEGVGEEVR